jgi:ABC-2 type transport system ATP-binding protein
MSRFEMQLKEVQSFLAFKDYPLVLKRIIDFALDTGSVTHYKKVAQLLDRCDNGITDAEKHVAFNELLSDLAAFLRKLPEKNPENILKVHEAVKRYGSSAFALGPVSLSLNEGQIIGLVGENGNGKTTLLRLLCGELHATAGTISYNFAYGNLYDLRAQLVYIPQRTETWRGPVYDNLVFAAAAYGYAPAENELIVQLVMARLGLGKFRNHKWKDLSSGYKMRFELARMLLRKPRVLLIDEPLANLDILSQQTILEDFRAIARSPFRPLGIILSSQQLYEVEKTSDQVIFLKNGIQKNLRNESEAPAAQPLVIEFESAWTQAELHRALLNYGLDNLSFNGGTYIATFDPGNDNSVFLKAVLSEDIPLTYFRDITHSTRRFFIS